MSEAVKECKINSEMMGQEEQNCCVPLQMGHREEMPKRDTLWWASGEYYSGDVVQGKMHGKGRYWTPSRGGLLYKGAFRDDKPNGWIVVQRTTQDPRECIFAGYMKDGNSHGPCMWTDEFLEPDELEDQTNILSNSAQKQPSKIGRMICFGVALERQTVGWSLVHFEAFHDQPAQLVLRKRAAPCLEDERMRGRRQPEWYMERFATGDVCEGQYFVDDGLIRFHGLGAYYSAKKRHMIVGRYSRGRMYGPIICYSFLHGYRAFGFANGISLHHPGTLELEHRTPLDHQQRHVDGPLEPKFRRHVHIERLYFMKREQNRKEIRQSMFGLFFAPVFASHVI